MVKIPKSQPSKKIQAFIKVGRRKRDNHIRLRKKKGKRLNMQRFRLHPEHVFVLSLPSL